LRNFSNLDRSDGCIAAAAEAVTECWDCPDMAAPKLCAAAFAAAIAGVIFGSIIHGGGVIAFKGDKIGESALYV
jgi:hypothetical protein